MRETVSQSRIDVHKGEDNVRHMCLTDLLNIILLFFQLIILALQLVLMRGQLMLSEKIDKDSKRRDKGYFIIGETNFPYDVEKEPIYKENFDLHLPIKFYLSGNSDVAVQKAMYSINGRECSVRGYEPLFCTLDRRMNRYDLEVELQEQDYQEKCLDIVVELRLENLSGYQYTEVIKTRFIKGKELDNAWYLEKYNMVFNE